MERMMTTEEVAELLRIDAVTVRRLATRGELTAYRIAGEYRFTPSGVESFVEDAVDCLVIRHGVLGSSCDSPIFLLHKSPALNIFPM